MAEPMLVELMEPRLVSAMVVDMKMGSSVQPLEHPVRPGCTRKASESRSLMASEIIEKERRKKNQFLPLEVMQERKVYIEKKLQHKMTHKRENRGDLWKNKSS
jgi:hypothetical protein